MKKHQEEKKTHGKRLSSRDPQQLSRGADPSRRTVKRRLRQLERKGQEKKIRNRAKKHKRQKTQRPLMAQVGSVSGNQNREIRKREWQQSFDQEYLSFGNVQPTPSSLLAPLEVMCPLLAEHIRSQNE